MNCPRGRSVTGIRKHDVNVMKAASPKLDQSQHSGTVTVTVTEKGPILMADFIKFVTAKY
jgi:hypothetical protein